MTYINTALVRMITAVSGLRARMSEERGQDLLEYALLGGLIAVALLVFGALFTPFLSTMASGIGACIDFTSSSVCDPGP